MKKLVFGLSVLMAAGAMASECSVLYSTYSEKYYVTNNGNRMSDFTKSLDRAVDDAYELSSYGVCNQPTPKKECKLMYSTYSEKYYLMLGSDRISDFKSRLSEISDVKLKLVRNGICYDNSSRTTCELKMSTYSNKWYVMKGTDRVSPFVTTIKDANSYAQALADEGACLVSGYQPIPRPVYSSNDDVNYVYDFRGSAENLSERIISLVKTLEPYINNAHEEEMDDIKKKAARLKARAHTRDIVKLATTARELEAIMDRNEGYMMELMETDALDRLSIELITISENLKAMLDYLQVQSQDYM
ncbi:MAG: hypothetical protein CME62_07235 [Halobacteriovoraceae bacterium]|nr:hypothetical protein [Halobacteriovoraceae bacterium]|tara:strand:- start:14477 stop:15382 length:906 start_codon:yes stop_codon:yes gene_type:complete